MTLINNSFLAFDTILRRSTGCFRGVICEYHALLLNATSRLTLLIAADNSSAFADVEEAGTVPLCEQIDNLEGSYKGWGWMENKRGSGGKKKK